MQRDKINSPQGAQRQDDLVKRLREGDHFEKVMSAEQAAARIEMLEAKLAKVTAALDAADRLADVLNDLLSNRGHCFIPNKIGGRKDWDDDANEALAAYRAQGET